MTISIKEKETAIYQKLSGQLKKEHANSHLLYGLTPIRQLFITHLKLQDKNGFFTADRVNKVVLQGIVDSNHRFTQDLLNSFKKKKQHKSVSTYLKVLMNCNNEKVQIKRNDFPKKSSLGDDYAERRIRRNCKALLYTQGEYKILFCLDGIDLRHVFNKSYSQKNPAAKGQILYDTHTSAEIRFICKNWEQLKNNIEFYSDGNQIKTPDWITNPKKIDNGTQYLVTKSTQLAKLKNAPPPPEKQKSGRIVVQNERDSSNSEEAVEVAPMKLNFS